MMSESLPSAAMASGDCRAREMALVMATYSNVPTGKEIASVKLNIRGDELQDWESTTSRRMQQINTKLVTGNIIPASFELCVACEERTAEFCDIL
jgi:hypothetical protein